MTNDEMIAVLQAQKDGVTVKELMQKLANEFEARASYHANEFASCEEEDDAFRHLGKSDVYLLASDMIRTALVTGKIVHLE